MRSLGGVAVMFWFVGFVACGAADGGDDDAATGGPWHSGTRTRARLATASDGFEVLYRWLDTERDVECSSTAFLPCGAERAGEDSEGNKFYADQDCTVRAVRLDAPAANQGYAVNREDDGEHVYRIALQPLPLDTGFVGDAGQCIPISGLDGLFPVIEELGPGDMVVWRLADRFGADDEARVTDDGALEVVFLAGATRAIDDATTRLRLVLDRRGDGVAAVGVHDTELDIGCAPVETADGLVCLPVQTLFFIPPMFSDSACQTMVDASPEPGIRYVANRGVIEGVASYETAVGPFYTAFGGCELQAASYAPVDLPLDSFESLALVTE